MPDEATRDTVPDGSKPYTVYVSWTNGKPELVGEPPKEDARGYAKQRPVFELKHLSPARAKQLVEVLNEYGERCIAVKKALAQTDHHDNAGHYHEARERKHAHQKEVFAVVETILAHIGVHAHEPE
jgi:hypothetical protein